jgi:hypothetical protein
MRWIPLIALIVGCGELSGAAPFAEVGPSDTGTRDTAPVDAAPPGLNDIDGYYVDEAVPKTRAIYRLDRASDPGHPRIVIISTADDVKIPCETFKLPDWNTRMPAGAMIHVLDLGTSAPGTFTVRPDAPPASDGALVGRTFQSTGMLSFEKAPKGRVIITNADVSKTSGSFDATYVVFYDDDPMPYDNKISATFVAPACAVD